MSIEEFFDHSPEAKMRVAARKFLARGIPAKDFRRLAGLDELRETEPLARARDWLAGPRRMLVLGGDVGVGKTTALAWAAAQDPAPDFGWRNSGVPWPEDLAPRFLDAGSLATVSRYKSEEMRPILDCALLVLDDLGMEYADGAGSFVTTLDLVLNHRYHNELRTAISTNLTSGDFVERYGKRLADRLSEAGSYFELAGRSLRRDEQA